MKINLLAAVLTLSLLAGSTLTAPVIALEGTVSTCSLATAQQTQAIPRAIAPEDLRVGPGYSTPVISAAQKFIIPVPAFGAEGEPLVYPPGHENEGQPILDYEGNPVGDRGIVFFNGKDQSWQAARGDGEAVIIINEVTAEQAEQLYQNIQTYSPDPNNLSLAQLQEVIAYAQADLGLVDMYNSDRVFIRDHMTPAIVDEVPTVNGQEITAYGFKKRDNRSINQAIYIPGDFVFAGPAATPQEFNDGGVIIEQGGEMRGVQPDIFLRTYRLSDGSTIGALPSDIANQCQ